MIRGTPAPYFQSLTRPLTLMGVIRPLFYSNLGMMVFIAYSAQFAPIADIAAGVIGLVGYSIAVLLTRVDNDIVPIYKRHIHYAAYYEPQASIIASSVLVKPSVLFYEGKKGLV